MPRLAFGLALGLLAFAGDARATCMGACSLDIVADADEQRVFVPSDRLLTVTGDCWWSCSAPGGPASTTKSTVKDLEILEEGQEAVHGFMEVGPHTFRFPKKIGAGKVYTVAWAGGKSGVPFVVADAAIVSATGPTATATPALTHEGKTYLVNGTKLTLPPRAFVELQLVGGRVSLIGPAEGAIEAQALRLTKGRAYALAGTVRVRTSGGNARFDGTGWLSVDGATTRISAYGGPAVVEGGPKIEPQHGVVLEKGKSPKKTVPLQPSPSLPPYEIVMPRPAPVALASVATAPPKRARLWVVTLPDPGVPGDPLLRSFALPEEQKEFGEAKLPIGNHLLRWSLIDDLGLESEPGPERALRVAHVELLHRPAKRASIFFPQAGLCGLDGAPLLDHPSSEIELVPARPHVLRCARTGTGPVTEHVISAADAGPVTLDLQASKLVGPRTREVLVRVIDASGGEVWGMPLTLTLSAGATADPVEEVPSPYGGRRFRSKIRWDASAKTVVLTATVPGGFHVARSVPVADP